MFSNFGRPNHVLGALLLMLTAVSRGSENVPTRQFYGKKQAINCERTTVENVKCNATDRIVVQYAVYGHEGGTSRCARNVSETCTAELLTCPAKDKCDGMQNCMFRVGTLAGLLGFDPCSGKRKYLYLEYDCVDSKHVIDARLSNSSLPYKGLLEIGYNDDTRTKVCNQTLSNKEREIICKQLGYQGIKYDPRVSNLYESAANFSSNVTCKGQDSNLTECCVTKIPKEDCSSLAFMSCYICDKPILEDKKKLPDSVFTSSRHMSNHEAAKARISSKSSWCAPSVGANNFLDINLGRMYFISKIATFGDSSSPSWVTKYNLRYIKDKENWAHGSTKTDIQGNKDAHNNVAILDLKEGIQAKALRLIPLSSRGNPCMRVELCGYPLYPDQVRSLTITGKTSSSVTFSWTPPPDNGGRPVTHYRIVFFLRNITEIHGTFVSNTTNSGVFRALKPYTQYKLLVQARNQYGLGEEMTITFTTSEAAPSGPPQNVSVRVRSSSSIFVSWEAPEEDKRNGIITSYTVCISRSSQGDCFKSKTTTLKNVTITNLNESTKYFVRVRASTKAGSGISSNATGRYTNGGSLSSPSNSSTKTLTFPLQVPSGNIRYFQVIALKLPNEENPGRTPNSYGADELLSYSEANTSSQPEPYIAAISETVPKEFVLGDGRNFSIPNRRRRRRSVNSYYNGPLERNTSYSIFQRFYVDADDYYSTGWSPPARTLARTPVASTNPASSTSSPTAAASESASDARESSLLLIIGVCVGVLCLILLVFVLLIGRRRRSRNSGSSKHANQQMELLRSPDNGRVNAGRDDVPGDEKPDGAEDALEIGEENEDENERRNDEKFYDDEGLYGNQEVITARERRGPIPVSELDSHVHRMKHDTTYDFSREFQELPSGHQFNWDIAKRSFNNPKNRYGNIVTYDAHRVVLSGDEKTDYINATDMNGIKENYYIATQGPKSSTINDFWRMVFEYKCPTIVMVTSLKEMGKVKCEKYWPDGSQKYGEIQVTALETTVFADYVTRKFTLEEGDEKLEVMQFHFTNWPDHGVPHYPTQLLSFRRHFKAEHNKRTGPAVIHCSAGVGRTGVFLAVDKTIDELEGDKEKNTVDIFALIKDMRTRRTNMVQTVEQYVFIHECILDHVKCGVNEIDAANLKIEIIKLSSSSPEGETGFGEKFKRLNDVSPRFASDECDSALLPKNKSKNRHADIYPNEVSRVCLKYLEDVENSDYINACYVDGYLGKNYFIATQTPLKETINDFWRMIFEHNSSTILMLNQLKENDEEYPMFWPVERAKPSTFGSVTLQLDSAIKKNDNIILRKFVIAPSPDLEGRRTIRLIQYIGWPDHGTPKKSDDVLELLSEVEQSKRAAEKGPVTVMCSDGAGRTGTYIAISNLVDRVKVVQLVDVFQCIKQLRSNRPQFVENEKQFKTCYEVIEALLKSFNSYSNFEMKEL